MTATFKIKFDSQPALDMGTTLAIVLGSVCALLFYVLSILHAKNKIDMFKLCRRRVLTPEE